MKQTQESVLRQLRRGNALPQEALPGVVKGLGLRVLGLRFRAWGLGFTDFGI